MGSPRILVVDDDGDTRIYLTMLLEDNGYEVESAGDAATARRMLDDFEPAAILMDVLMPGRSGLDLLTSLRRDPRWCDTTLILITGNDQVVQDAGRSYPPSSQLRGPDGIISKPVDREELLRTLNDSLKSA